MKKKLGIISNYNESCGIASYAGAIVEGFQKFSDYDLSTHSIDTTLAKSNLKGSEKLRFSQFKRIGKEVGACDYVNIQFENGLFGQSHSEVIRNLKAILNRKTQFTFTMHTADFFEGAENSGSYLDALKHFLTLRMKAGLGVIYQKFAKPFMVRFISLIKDYPNVSIIVHTKREERLFKKFFGFEKVYSHPLVFLPKEKAKDIRETEDASDYRQRFNLDQDDKVVAIYGFVTEYKGHLTAIKALRHLPDNYKLIIAGAQHPQSIERHTEANQYFESLFQAIEKVDNVDYGKLTLAETQSLSVAGRVQFEGFISDDDMLKLMRNADVSLYPYLETGQSGSGPASLGLEVGAKMLVSNAHVFSELSKFAPDCFERFDIGNYYELADKVKLLAENRSSIENSFNKKYSLESNIEFYSEVVEGK